jgi:hypothetical protein
METTEGVVMRRTVKSAQALILAIVLAVGIAVPAIAGDAYVTQQAGDGYSVASVEENGFGGSAARSAYANVVSSGQFDTWLCPNGIDNENCKADAPGVTYWSRQLLSPCQDATSENCIENLTIIGPDGAEHNAKLLETLRDDSFTPAVPSQGLFGSKGISLYEDDSVQPAVRYAVVFWDSLRYERDTNHWRNTGIDVTVAPYRQVSGNYENKLEKVKQPDGKLTLLERVDNASCMWNDSTRCAKQIDFAPETRVRLTSRVSKEITGWFRGRITKSNIAVKPFSSANNLLSVEANTVNVARMRAVVSPTNSTPEQQQAIITHGGMGGNTVFHNEIKSPFANWGEFSWLEMFRGLANDTAAGISTSWSFSTIEAPNNNRCMADSTRVLGVVSTNATLYNGETPTFENGMLTYKVAGLHYMPDGKTLSEGTYDLVMRSDVARCLYGFSKAPISATVSVIGSNGETKTAVTTVNETGDGWLKLTAYGFTFSSPTIQVKLTQASTPTSSIPAPATSTITCVKGKTTKKVSGTSPKCPAGFKKK